MLTKFCSCGRAMFIVNEKWYCPKHGNNPPEKKETQKKYSGKSKSEFAFNEYK